MASPSRRLPRPGALLLAAALAAGAPGRAAPPLPGPGETPAARAREALAARDVPFERHAFLAAAAEGDLELVDLFLDAGMPAAARDARGDSAVLEAARHDHVEILRRLLARGAKAGESPGGEPPLVVAAEAGSLRCLAELLAAGAPPDQPADPERGPGGTALQRALAAEAWEAARLLLEAGAGAGVAAPPLPPPLVLASESGHAPSVSLLLGLGADPNARAAGGLAPLKAAAWNGQAEATRLLLLAGADAKTDRAALLAGRPGQPLTPEVRKLLLHPPKPAAKPAR